MAISVLIAALAIASPQNFGDPIRTKGFNMDKPMQDYIASLQTFGGRLFSAASKKAPGNLFVSPVSAHIAFGMLSNGLQGNCLKETEKMLGIGTANLNNQTKEFYTRTRIDGGKVLSISNGVWNIQPAKLMPDYLKTVRDAYDAESASLNWQTGADVVNAWVKKKTRERIPSILQKLNPDDGFVIVNALAFDSDWAHPFKADDTFEDTFNNGKSNPKIKMMSQTQFCLSGVWGGRPVVVMPYKSDYAMVAILPAKSESPADVIVEMAKSNWVKVFGSLKEQRTDIWLPKFKIESQINIKEILSALGAPSLLRFSRDFEPMVGNIPAAVGQAVQKVFIEVDEKGTKAAAATAIVGTLGAAMPQKAFEFHANRPFVVALVEWPTAIPVVLGAVYDPSK